MLQLNNNQIEHTINCKRAFRLTKMNSSLKINTNSSSSGNSMASNANLSSTPTSIIPPTFYFNSNATAQTLSNSTGQMSQQPTTYSGSVSNTPTTTTTTAAATTNSNSSIMHEEKVYKKEKQILVEFDSKTKGMIF